MSSSPGTSDPHHRRNLSLEWLLVSPQVAQQLLEGNTNNRPLRDHHVKRLARDMTEGRWKFDCMPVRLTAKGRILDGQHRLWAVMESGVAVWMLIAHGVDEAAYSVMDSGMARSWADNAGSTKTMSGAIGLMHLWETGRLGSYSNAQFRATNLERDAILKRFPGLQETKTIKKIPLFPSQQVFLKIVFGEKDPKLCAWFFESLEAGINLDQRMAVYHLRQRLLTQGPNNKLGAEAKLALAIKAWNAHRKNVPVASLRWEKAREGFPEIL